VLKQVLERAGVSRMVVGHTIQDDGITWACGGQVYRVDVRNCPSQECHRGTPMERHNAHSNLPRNGRIRIYMKQIQLHFVFLTELVQTPLFSYAPFGIFFCKTCEKNNTNGVCKNNLTLCSRRVRKSQICIIFREKTVSEKAEIFRIFLHESIADGLPMICP